MKNEGEKCNERVIPNLYVNQPHKCYLEHKWNFKLHFSCSRKYGFGNREVAVQ